MFFRRGPSICDSYATLYTIAARNCMRAAAPRQRVHAQHAPKVVQRRYRVRPRRRRVLDGRRCGAAQEGLPLVNRDGRAARRTRSRRGRRSRAGPVHASWGLPRFWPSLGAGWNRWIHPRITLDKPLMHLYDETHMQVAHQKSLLGLKFDLRGPSIDLGHVWSCDSSPAYYKRREEISKTKNRFVFSPSG